MGCYGAGFRGCEEGFCEVGEERWSGESEEEG